MPFWPLSLQIAQSVHQTSVTVARIALFRTWYPPWTTRDTCARCLKWSSPHQMFDATDSRAGRCRRRWWADFWRFLQHRTGQASITRGLMPYIFESTPPFFQLLEPWLLVCAELTAWSLLVSHSACLLYVHQLLTMCHNSRLRLDSHYSDASRFTVSSSSLHGFSAQSILCDRSWTYLFSATLVFWSHSTVFQSASSCSNAALSSMCTLSASHSICFCLALAA